MQALSLSIDLRDITPKVRLVCQKLDAEVVLEFGFGANLGVRESVSALDISSRILDACKFAIEHGITTGINVSKQPEPA